MRVARLLLGVMLASCNVALLAMFVAFRDPWVRWGSAAALIAGTAMMMPVTILPAMRWWRDPGKALRSTGRFTRSTASTALAFLMRFGKRCSPQRAQLLYDSGVMLLEQCRYRESAEKLRESASLFAELGELNHEALAYIELGSVESAAGNHAAAITALEKALAMWEQLSVTHHQDNTWRLFNNLGVAHGDQGSLEEAEGYYRRAFLACRQRKGDAHADVATCLLNLADVHRKQRQFSEASDLVQQSLEILHRTKDENFAHGVCLLAMVRDDQEKVKEAEDLYLQARKLFEQQLGPGHAEVARVLESYGAMLERSGRGTEGAALLARAASIRDTIG